MLYPAKVVLIIIFEHVICTLPCPSTSLLNFSTISCRIAIETEKLVRDEGCVPATVAVINGRLHVGLEEKQLEHLADYAGAMKVSKRDLAYSLAQVLAVFVFYDKYDLILCNFTRRLRIQCLFLVKSSVVLLYFSKSVLHDFSVKQVVQRWQLPCLLQLQPISGYLPLVVWVECTEVYKIVSYYASFSCFQKLLS